MSKDKSEDDKPHIPSGGVSKSATPRAIAARSQAWNSSAKIVILGVALFCLLVLTGIALFIRPEAMRDLLWASVSLIAYLAGSGELARKDEK
ncbi:unnamed protein product [Gemmata massiliana]|uniref:Uncharacterized protein n=1 Tax=Gemmata massiliana TaxID=1210884 RepID=A0A6P2CTE7_9BACT|nr:hypothetical protein [Gemmata massiliana]VTR92231.1 unnamed protein product [Gemmata massiliana]